MHDDDDGNCIPMYSIAWYCIALYSVTLRQRTALLNAVLCRDLLSHSCWTAKRARATRTCITLTTTLTSLAGTRAWTTLWTYPTPLAFTGDSTTPGLPLPATMSPVLISTSLRTLDLCWPTSPSPGESCLTNMELTESVTLSFCLDFNQTVNYQVWKYRGNVGYCSRVY